ncbi:MAG: hypothetical protein IJH78_03005 [Clostridia bacterium]|nr:hypothetical protein [Clostridia bacterium]
MEGIVGIVLMLVFWSLFGSLARKNPKKTGTRPARPPAAPPRKSADDGPPSGVLNNSAPRRIVPPEARLTLEDLGEGESLSDPHGCVGGSLSFHSEEGESSGEHAEHMARAMAAPKVETAARQGRFSASDLRQAVITREILDRPKSRRRSGQR